MKKIVPKNAHLIPKEAKKVFEGKLYNVYQWEQKLFDGSRETFEMLGRRDGTDIIAIKDGKIVTLKQLQPQWDRPRYTLPGGRMEEGESPLEAAKREMLEETGMSFNDWRLIEVIQNHEKIEYFIHIFLAQGFISETETHIDAGEQIEVELLDFEKLKELSVGEPRLRIFNIFDSFDALLNAPEFEGREIEV